MFESVVDTPVSENLPAWSVRSTSSRALVRMIPTVREKLSNISALVLYSRNSCNVLAMLHM